MRKRNGEGQIKEHGKKQTVSGYHCLQRRERPEWMKRTEKLINNSFMYFIRNDYISRSNSRCVYLTSSIFPQHTHSHSQTNCPFIFFNFSLLKFYICLQRVYLKLHLYVLYDNQREKMEGRDRYVDQSSKNAVKSYMLSKSKKNKLKIFVFKILGQAKLNQKDFAVDSYFTFRMSGLS